MPKAANLIIYFISLAFYCLCCYSLVGSMYQTFYPHTLGAGMAHRARMCHIGAIGAWLIDRRCQGAGNPGAGEWRDGNWAGGGANKVDGGAKSPEKLWQA